MPYLPPAVFPAQSLKETAMRIFGYEKFLCVKPVQFSSRAQSHARPRSSA
jgi:hypothetical protein